MFQVWLEWVRSLPGFETLAVVWGFLSELWHQVEGLVLIGGLWYVGHRIKRERTKFAADVDQLGERVETFGQFAKAAREAADTVVASGGAGEGEPNAAAPAGLARWEELRGEWLEVRDRIELAVERIGHKTVRGKYAKINRYSYRDVIVSLREDDEISSAVETALLNMNGLFLGLRSRPAKTTAADVTQMRAWIRAINGALPKITKPKTPSDEDGPPPAAAA